MKEIFGWSIKNHFMIKGSELRVWNWVNYKSEPILVTMIGVFGIQSDMDGVIVNAKFITPDLTGIPLTPEILEKCGFKPFCKDWSKKGMIIHSRKRGFVLNKKVPILTSLHQLQNLYYALTGEELEISL